MVQVTPLRRTLTSFPYFECASCHQQGHMGSKTLLQQNLPVLNCGCRLTQVIYYIIGTRLSVCWWVTEVDALYGRLSCSWLRVVCVWQHTLWWEVGVSGCAWSARGDTRYGGKWALLAGRGPCTASRPEWQAGRNGSVRIDCGALTGGTLVLYNGRKMVVVVE